MVRTATGMGIGTSIGIGGYAAMDKLLEHGDLGILTFGVLTLSGLFFGWLMYRRT